MNQSDEHRQPERHEAAAIDYIDHAREINRIAGSTIKVESKETIKGISTKISIGLSLQAAELAGKAMLRALGHSVKKIRNKHNKHDIFTLLKQVERERGVAIFAKAFMGIPAQQAAKITRPPMPSAAPAVLSLSFATQQGDSSHHPNDSTRFRKACIFTTQKTLRENTCPIASGDYSTPVSQRLQKQPNQELKPYHHFLLRTPKINGIEIGHTTADYFQRHFAKGPSALPRSYFYPEHPTFAGPKPYHALFFIVDDLIKVAESVIKIVEQ